MCEKVSLCNRDSCIHFYVCKNKEQYQKIISDNPSVIIDKEIPNFMETVTTVSLLCKFYKLSYGNCAPKYRNLERDGYECTTCDHLLICKNQEDFLKICDMLKGNKTPFVLHCPYYKKILKEEI